MLDRILNDLIIKSRLNNDYAIELYKGSKGPFMDIPQELAEFYSISDGGVLFKDVEYGQWGLHIYTYEELLSKNEYARTWKGGLLKTDLVVGEFLGDLDLLFISTESRTYGQVAIAVPIYERENWFFLEMGFSEFLIKFIEAEGEKFWES